MLESPKKEPPNIVLVTMQTPTFGLGFRGLGFRFGHALCKVRKLLLPCAQSGAVPSGTGMCKRL